MFEILVKSQFNSAHQLRGYHGKCEELHGHNWLVEVRVRGEKLNETGLLVDFIVVKKHLRKVLETLDHKYINDLPAFKTINPTSENMARYIYEQLKSLLAEEHAQPASVSVWETDTSCATYSES